MKNILITLLLLLFQNPDYQLQTDLSEKILGQWVLDATKTVEKLPDGTTVDRKSGPLERTTVYFKSDNTGNFNFTDKDSEKFSWVINKNKITINYPGENVICKPFNGDFKIIIRDRKGSQKLELIKSNLTISLSK